MEHGVAGRRIWSRWYLDVALVPLLLGIVLRVWRWGSNPPLWLDEQMIGGNLRGRGYAQLVGALSDNQSAPLGWLWAERAMLVLFGTGERQLRVVPLLFGIGTLVVAFLIGRRWLGPVGRFVLVALAAVNLSFIRYSGELKHYSADTFWVFALLGLAGWVIERPASVRRILLWWAAAVAASWLSLGAILAVPGLSLVIIGAAVLDARGRSGRWAAAIRTGLPGLVWLASAGLHYLLSIRYATGSQYLAGYWSGLGYPPDGAGPLGIGRWLVRRAEVLAADPLFFQAGLGSWPARVVAALFWAAALAGLVLAFLRRRAFGLLLAAPIATGFVLATARVVPLAGRLALWLVPPMLISASTALDAVARLVVRAPRPRVVRAALASVAGVAALALLAALVPFTEAAVRYTATRPAVDDRAAVAWLKSQHRPGDLTLVVGSAIRALQWYDQHGELRPARVVLLSKPGGAGCDHRALGKAIESHSRLLVYSGVRLSAYRDAPRVLRDELGRLGRIVEVRQFGGGDSVAYVVDLRAPPRLAGSANRCITPA